MNAAYVPPQNLDAEESVLGAMMVSETAVEAAIADARLGAEDFYRERHRMIFGAISALHSRGAPVDALTVTEQLTDSGELAEAGGKELVSSLASTVPVAGNAGHYATIVRDNARLRRALRASHEIQREIVSREIGPRDAVARLEGAAYELLADQAEADSRALEDLMVAESERLEARRRGEREEGVGLPWPALQARLGPLKPGQLIVVAARPGEGKSTFALNLAEHVARTEERAVAFFSLEMSDEEVSQKLIASRAGVDSSRLRAASLDDRAFRRVAEQSERLAALAMMVNTRSYQDLAGIRVESRRFGARAAQRGRPLGLIVVDYLQLLVPPPETERQNRTQQVSALSRGLKILAGQLQAPIVVCSQLNRELERQGRKPILSDLRDSGQVEADANAVLFLHGGARREEEEDDDPFERHRSNGDRAAEASGSERSVIVAKNRTGPTGEIRLAFDEPRSLWLTPAHAGDESPAPD